MKNYFLLGVLNPLMTCANCDDKSNNWDFFNPKIDCNQTLNQIHYCQIRYEQVQESLLAIRSKFPVLGVFFSNV